MAEGKLIIEVYEYAEGDTSVPKFEYIPCDLADCMKKGQKATLAEIVKKGFNELPKWAMAGDKMKAILHKLDEAGIGHIDVVYHPAGNGFDSYIEFTNLVQETLTDSDMRRARGNKKDIILHDHYRLADNNESTRLKDAQRLTLIYSTQNENTPHYYEAEESDDQEIAKAFFLNITYLQK